MKSVLKYILFFTVFLLYCSYIVPPDSDWKKEKEENGIIVYTRDGTNSDFKDLKCVTTIKASLSSLITLLNDFETYPQWVYRCEKSLTLKKISEMELIHYQTISAPWPADNRDFVVNIKISQDLKTNVVTQKATSVPDFIPPIPGHVRIKEFDATWTFTPNKDGTVQAVYQLMVDPGGNIPAWLVNMAVVEGPYETTFNLREWVKKDKYQKAKLPFIKELQ